MDMDEALLTAEEAMEKAAGHLKTELRGIRTGRASTALVEFVKIDYFGSPTELRQLAMISVPEPTQILVKPFDPSSVGAIEKGLQNAGLGLNPMVEAKQIRINLPPLTGERRKQLMGAVKQMGEQAKITIRNTRRDGNKHIDSAGKDKTLHLSEDDIESAKDEMQKLVKKYESSVNTLIASKNKEITEI